MLTYVLLLDIFTDIFAHYELILDLSKPLRSLSISYVITKYIETFILLICTLLPLFLLY